MCNDSKSMTSVLPLPSSFYSLFLFSSFLSPCISVPHPTLPSLAASFPLSSLRPLHLFSPSANCLTLAHYRNFPPKGVTQHFLHHRLPHSSVSQSVLHSLSLSLQTRGHSSDTSSPSLIFSSVLLNHVVQSLQCKYKNFEFKI